MRIACFPLQRTGTVSNIISCLSLLAFGGLFAQQDIGGRTVSVTISNQSDRSLEVLRGGRPGQGNNAGQYRSFPNRSGVIRPDSTITTPSVQGRVWSFLLGGKLVSSYTTGTRGSQSFAISQADVDAAQRGERAQTSTEKPEMTENEAITLKLLNESGLPVTIATRDSEGQLQLIGNLNTGQSTEVQSKAGLDWYFLDPKKQLVSSYRTTGAVGQTFRIAGTNVAGKTTIPSGTPVGGNRNPRKGTGSKLTGTQAKEMVKYHNEARSEGRIRNPEVKWSNKIARYAQQRADSIAAARQYPPRHLPPGQNPYGENLAAGKAAGTVQSVASLYRKWKEDEINAFRQLGAPRIFNNQAYSNFQAVGHYTQMIWQNTSEIGAGVASWREGEWTVTVVVCCYGPKGNILNGTIY